MHDPRSAFDSRLANIYDLIYQGRGKDYAAEAAEIAGLIRSARPAAASLVDVACGTGLHLRAFGDLFAHVEGVELSEDMLLIAKNRNPNARLHLGDMRDFELAGRFDAVTCLFAGIGHMRTAADLDVAVAQLVKHLVPGGVAVVEPWWFPADFTPGYVGGDIVNRDGYTIARVSHTTRDGDVTTMEVHYVVAHPESGIRHFTNAVVNSLFTQRRYEEAFEKAGATVRYQGEGPSGRGRFVAVRE